MRNLGGRQRVGAGICPLHAGATGRGGSGVCCNGGEDLGQTLMLLQGWDFGLQQDPVLCPTERKELGNPPGILCYTNVLSQHKEGPQLVTALQPG